jgi:hypothetical protein
MMKQTQNTSTPISANKIEPTKMPGFIHSMPIMVVLLGVVVDVLVG